MYSTIRQKCEGFRSDRVFGGHMLEDHNVN